MARPKVGSFFSVSAGRRHGSVSEEYSVAKSWIAKCAPRLSFRVHPGMSAMRKRLRSEPGRVANTCVEEGLQLVAPPMLPKTSVVPNGTGFSPSSTICSLTSCSLHAPSHRSRVTTSLGRDRRGGGGQGTQRFRAGKTCRESARGAHPNRRTRCIRVTTGYRPPSLSLQSSEFHTPRRADGPAPRQQHCRLTCRWHALLAWSSA